MAETRSREELEARLKEKAQSISSRFDKFESSLPGKNIKVPEVLRKKRNIKIGLAIGAGFLIGYKLLNRSNKRSGSDYGESLERLADRLGDAISDRLKRSDSPVEAVREALEDNPPIVQMNADREGPLSGAIRQLLNSGSSVLVSEFGRWLQHRLVEDKAHPEGD